MINQHHWIKKTDLRTTTWKETPAKPLEPGMVRLKIDAFALTANNVTYASFGGAPMHYWNFFPTEDPDFGRVPVWGFATVEESACEGVTVGQRVYGYFPISTYLDVEVIRLSERGFMDGASHRQGLAPIYNTYSFTSMDPAYVAEHEAEQMLFRPLYLTGWMICDNLMEAEIKPDAVIISSASSKTAIATAHGLHRRGVRTIGLTSAGNVEFVQATGLYSEVLSYDKISAIRPSAVMAYVDFVGRPSLTLEVHTHCGDALKRSMMIGATDWQADRTLTALPGPLPEFFFVPDYAANRAKQLPPGELEKRMGADLVSFYPTSKRFVTAEALQGTQAIESAWIETLEGRVSPDRGLICRL